MTDLLNDLRAAEQRAASRVPPCEVCGHIRSMTPGMTRDALIQAAAGTIGVNTLAAIFKAHGIPAGRRTIERHRKDDHQP